MAKKLSKFGSAFAEARKSGKSEFDFGGKKFNTKMKGEGAKKSSKSKLPGSTSVTPKSRSSALDKSTARPSFSGMSDVAGNKGKGYLSGPSFRGGGPKIAMSKKNIDKRNAAKPKSGGFKDAMKKVSNSIKMGY